MPINLVIAEGGHCNIRYGKIRLAWGTLRQKMSQNKLPQRGDLRTEDVTN